MVTTVLTGEVSGMHTLSRSGADDTIVFLHGLGCSSESFAGIWDRADLGVYSVLCIDYLGHGKSETPDSFSYTVQDHARSVAAILAGYRHRPLHVVGHSLGGAIALHLPESVRESIVSFTNIEGNLTPDDCKYGSRRASSRPFDEFLRDVLPAFKKASQTWQDVGLNLAHPQAFFDTAASLVQLSDDGSLLESFLSWEGRKCYVHGDENTDHPSVHAIEGIETISIPKSGHFSMIDNPDVFYSQLHSFIRG
jgi:pimeloyl-ACP methyl ester carboxylesterase